MTKQVRVPSTKISLDEFIVFWKYAAQPNQQPKKVLPSPFSEIGDAPHPTEVDMLKLEVKILKRVLQKLINEEVQRAKKAQKKREEEDGKH